MHSTTLEGPGGPPSKRAKLDTLVEDGGSMTDEELDGDHCSICLQLLLDRTVVPECSHEFCFECIVTWTEQSRRCPLCSGTIGPYLIHQIRSNFDYQKYHLPPLRTSPLPIPPLRRRHGSSLQRISVQERRWGRRERREQDAADELERAIDRRRWIYHSHLYAKHCGCNRSSRFRPFPTPVQFAASQDCISRATIFIRRELRVWPNLDVEFLTTFIISLMKAIDIRSEPAIKLLADFLDMDRPYVEGRRFLNAEHFAHELYSFLRSPYKTLSAYDMSVQYDEPGDANRPADRDKNIASERRARLSPGSRVRHRIREHSRLGDGCDHSGSNLNAWSANDRSDQSSSSSSSFPDVERPGMCRPDGPNSDPAFRDGSSTSLPKEGLVLGRSDEEFGGSEASISNDRPAFHTQGRSEDKEVREPEDLVTATDPIASSDHRHNVTHSRVSENEVRQPLGNAPADAEDNSSTYQEESYSRQPPYQKPSQSIGAPSRTRNPLLIAQAHLSGGHSKRILDQSCLPPTRNDGSPSDLRQPSHSSRASKRPSLLSRISEPKEAQTDGLATELPELGQEGPLGAGRSVGTVNEELRAKLLHRLEAERAAQAERDQGINNTMPSPPPQRISRIPRTPSSFFIGSDPSGPAPVVDEHQTADLEAIARARARLKMKLTIEKHLHTTSSHHLGNAEIRHPEEKSIRTANREGMLRVVLENRRQGG